MNGSEWIIYLKMDDLGYHHLRKPSYTIIYIYVHPSLHNINVHVHIVHTYIDSDIVYIYIYHRNGLGSCHSPKSAFHRAIPKVAFT